MYEYFMLKMVKHIQNAHKSKINRQSQKSTKHNLDYHAYKKLDEIRDLTKKSSTQIGLILDFMRIL
jgi:hypothetical protein